MNYPQGIDEAAAVQYLSAKVDANLSHILQEAAVPLPVQYNFCQAFTSVRGLASYEDDRSKVRAALKTDFRLDGSTDLPTRAAVAALVSAWEAAQHFAAKDAELRAEARVLGVTRPVTQTDKAAMKASFEKSFYRLEEALEPSDEYLAQKMEELESQEPVASPLSEVTSKKTGKTMGIQTSVDSGGHVRIVKNKQKGSLPQGTEDFRTIMKLEGHTWCMLAAKFRNRELLRNMTPKCWEDYVSYLLGDKCYMMKIHSGKGGEQTALRPPWHVLLSFEHELRKEAVKRAHSSNRPLSDTLPGVCKDPELKERFFTSPIALQPHALETQGNKRNWYQDTGKGDWPADVPWPKWYRKGSPKGGKPGGKTGGKYGKGNKGKQPGPKGGRPNTLVDKTPDGREICFAFNAQGCSGGCNRLHICRVKGCGEAHAMWQHFAQLSISNGNNGKGAGAVAKPTN